MKLLVSKILIIAGLFCWIIGGFLFWQRVNPDRIKFTSYPTNVNTQENSSLPYTLEIASLNINLPIYPAKEWEVTNKGVSYLSTTPLPGELGNSVLYGHNWNNLLGKLTKVRRGDKIIIKYQNLMSSEFIVTDLQIVDPSEISVLENNGDRRLTIYTCSGLLDRKRFIVSARLSEDLASGI